MFKDNTYKLFNITLAVSVLFCVVMLAFKMFDNFPVTEKILGLFVILVPASGAYCMYRDTNEYEGSSKRIYMYILLFFAVREILGFLF